MAKISPVAAKYIIHSTILIEGVVDRPDVIGAIFGQTEGLLGNDLELRELQRSGRIGRIEVNVSTSSGKTKGEIIIPSSLDKTETAIVGAALEVIQRIGPCNAKVSVGKIEDVRISKRQFVVDRAKELLRDLTENTLPDSQEIADEVAQSVRIMEVVDFGREKLAAGPNIDESEDIIIVEGRADVLNLLKHGFKNAIAMNGTSCPESIKELTKKKSTTVFVDGDRGGNLIIRELLSVADIDSVCKAPDGKEVEEITKKEIHKALRGKITAEQAKLELGIDDTGALKEEVVPKSRFHERAPSRPVDNRRTDNRAGNNQSRKPESRFQKSASAPARPPMRKSVSVTAEEKGKFKATLDDLFGTRGACIFDDKLNILGKVPLSELPSTVKSLNGGVYALVLDGAVDLDLVKTAEKFGITHLIGTSTKVKESQRVNILTDAKLS
ncbi:DNA primase [Candidatus Woesearchaeota archaeon]|jgi:DNA primase|nr:DNA primase [Candidatus Woesearchaeota archaeon]